MFVKKFVYIVAFFLWANVVVALDFDHIRVTALLSLNNHEKVGLLDTLTQKSYLLSTNETEDNISVINIELDNNIVLIQIQNKKQWVELGNIDTNSDIKQEKEDLIPFPSNIDKIEQNTKLETSVPIESNLDQDTLTIQDNFPIYYSKLSGGIIHKVNNSYVFYRENKILNVNIEEKKPDLQKTTKVTPPYIPSYMIVEEEKELDIKATPYNIENIPTYKIESNTDKNTIEIQDNGKIIDVFCNVEREVKKLSGIEEDIVKPSKPEWAMSISERRDLRHSRF